MKATYRTRLASERSDLGSLAPLGAPFVLIVDPASHCNLKCKFCPTGEPALIEATGRYQGPMAFETFTKIIDDLQEFDRPIRVLRLYKEGEPLMNKRFADMVAYARASDRVTRIDTTTNGVLLVPKIAEKIVEAGIDQINISVNGIRAEQFIDLVRTKVNFDKYVENVRHLYDISRGRTEIYVKAIEENLSADDRKRFLDIFGDIADRVFFEHLFPNWPGFEADIIPTECAVGLYGDDVVERAACPYIFYSTTINSDGTVSLCVQDWARNLVVGDVAKESVKDIWLGDRLNAHRLSHLSGCRKDDATCAQCQCMSYGVFDNIDSKVGEIKERLLAAQLHSG